MCVQSILADIQNARKDDPAGGPAGGAGGGGVTQSLGLGLGPDSRFLRLEANCVYTHLHVPTVVEKYRRR